MVYGKSDGEGSGVKVARSEYKLARVRFVPHGKVPDEEEGGRKRRRLYGPVN